MLFLFHDFCVVVSFVWIFFFCNCFFSYHIVAGDWKKKKKRSEKLNSNFVFERETG